MAPLILHVLPTVCVLFSLLFSYNFLLCHVFRWTCCYAYRRRLTTQACRAATATAPVTMTNSWTPRWSQLCETEDYAGRRWTLQLPRGFFEPPSLIHTQMLYMCALCTYIYIYEKFCYTKWFIHHLKEYTYFYMADVQYQIKVLCV